MVTLRLKHWSDRGPHLVEVTLEGLGAPRTATTQFAFDLTAQDREDMRWYLEDYLLYPVAPTPEIAHRVEDRLNELGGELFTAVFRSDPETRELWDALAGSLPDVRVEIAAGYEGSAVPWELMRDPDADEALALRADAFVRIHTGAVRPQPAPGTAGNVLRVLLVICRPGGAADVPFRSVASQLVRLGRTARDAFQLSVLRPPTFAQLSRVLKAAQACGTPYHVVHFDGHGIYLDEDDATAAITRDRQPHGSSRFSFASPPRPGR